MNLIFGYARVSLRQQSPDRQTDVLAAYGCAEIFTEKISGTKADRPALRRLKERLRPGDTVVVESWSRLGRSARDLFELTEWFEKKGVTLISLKENFSADTPQGKLMMTVFQAFAEFERDLAAQRTRESLQSARARGRRGGRPAKSRKDVELALTLYDSGQHSAADIARMTGVSSSSLYRYLGKRRQSAAKPPKNPPAPS